MKILHIITKSNWGGAQKYVFDLAVYSKKQGYDVCVALGGNGALNENLIKEGVRTHSIISLNRDVNASKDIISLKEIYNIIKNEKPNIVHLHSPKAAGLGALSARILRVKKIIYTVHGWTWNESRPLWEKISIGLLSWITMILSTYTIVLGERDLGQAQMFPFVIKKLRMIPLGIHIPKFLIKKTAREFLQSKTSKIFDKNTVILGTIAELHPNKGLIYAINAIDKIKDEFPSLIFFIIGEGDDRKNIEALIKDKKLEDKVILLGNIPNASQYLKAFSIFILPSVKEGLPYVILESAYAALPIIATAVGAIPEIIDDMKSGIVIQSKKTDEISSAIKFLIENNKLQKEYGKNLQEKVKTQFSIEKMFKSILDLYN